MKAPTRPTPIQEAALELEHKSKREEDQPKLRRRGLRRPPLTEDMILTWADDYFAKHGRWPRYNSGPVDSPGAEITWAGVAANLYYGNRGLAPGKSLATLLQERRSGRKGGTVPPLTVNQVEAWARAHFAEYGEWPTGQSGIIQGGNGTTTWRDIAFALRYGLRGLPAGLSLVKLRNSYAEAHGAQVSPKVGTDKDRLAAFERDRIERDVHASLYCKKGPKPPLDEWEILSWADAYFAVHGKWPNIQCGRVLEYPNGQCTWCGIDLALRKGLRGLGGGSSLARLLHEHRGLRNRSNLTPLSKEVILSWADDHFARHGRWPTSDSGSVEAQWADTSWSAVNSNLQNGDRGLPAGSSLARLLEAHRGVRNVRNLPQLSEHQILAWADTFHAGHGAWPTKQSGLVSEDPIGQSTWLGIDQALRNGLRGLEGGASLALLLKEHRGKRNHHDLPPLTEDLILSWADDHFGLYGRWPTLHSGAVKAPGTDTTWMAVNGNLYNGGRGLVGGSSLAQLLEARRGVRNIANLPKISQHQILIWARAYLSRNGRWPNKNSGIIRESNGDVTWLEVNRALQVGLRGLPGGSSLFKLKNSLRDDPETALDESQILIWADAYYAANGRWPTLNTRQIPAEDVDMSWHDVDKSLKHGFRGLPGGSSLFKLLQRERGAHYGRYVQPLSVEKILVWADEYHAMRGRWPSPHDGAFRADDPLLTWTAVDMALRNGLRGLPGGTSLAILLREQRGWNSRRRRATLSEDQILIWADEYFARHGKWPNQKSGQVESPGAETTWAAIQVNLLAGNRGLPGGSTLSKLIREHRTAK